MKMVDRTLMREPETERIAAELDAVQSVREQDTRAERTDEPDGQIPPSNFSVADQ